MIFRYLRPLAYPLRFTKISRPPYNLKMMPYVSVWLYFLTTIFEFTILKS